MSFATYWRIETAFGDVEVELDEGGGPFTHPEDINDADSISFIVSCAIDNRDPRVTRDVLPIFAQFHPEYFPPGFNLKSLETRDIDPFRDELRAFFEEVVLSGDIKVFYPEKPLALPPEAVEDGPTYQPQDVVPERETWIGVELLDQDNMPVKGRVRITLPDGRVEIRSTSAADGTLKLEGLSLDGLATIELLDFNDPGEAEAAEDEPAADEPVVATVENEFTVKVVDETGKQGISGVNLVFTAAGTSKTVPTGSDGIAKHKAAAESASVKFESASELAKLMKPIWAGRPATAEDAFLQPGADITAVASRASVVETDKGAVFASVTVAAGATQTLTIRPTKKRAVLIELHDTLFRNDSAVINPEGEAPSSTGEHEAITTVGLIATLLRYNEEHPGKKLFIAGHTDRAGTESNNVALSELRAKAALALVEGKKEAFVAACVAKHSGVDVTQIFDWTHRNPLFDFACAPTKLQQSPAPETYWTFRQSFNKWIDAGTAAGETRGTRIASQGVLTADIWGATFDLYEYALREELGEKAGDLDTLRGKIAWVDGSKKTIGFGENHPTADNTFDGTRSQADRRVEVMLFEEEDLPDLAAGNGADVYNQAAYARKPIEPMVSAKKWRAYWEVKTDPTTGEELPARMDDVRNMILDAPGLPDGTAVEVIVYQGSERGQEPTAQAVVSYRDKEPLGAFMDWFNADLVRFEESRTAWPEVKYSFSVQAAGRRVESMVLPYGDWVDTTVWADKDDGLPVSGHTYWILTAWGARKGSLGDDGKVSDTGLPPGDAAVLVNAPRLVEKGA